MVMKQYNIDDQSMRGLSKIINPTPMLHEPSPHYGITTQALYTTPKPYHQPETIIIMAHQTMAYVASSISDVTSQDDRLSWY